MLAAFERAHCEDYHSRAQSHRTHLKDSQASRLGELALSSNTRNRYILRQESKTLAD